MKTTIAVALFTILVAGFFTSASADGILKRLINGDGIKGSGDMVTRDRDVAEFNKIRMSGAFDVYVTIGTEQRVTITFDDNLIDLVKTETKGKTLRIYSDESYSSRKGCKVEITVPELLLVDASGSGDITIEDLKQDMFEYEISGSGDANINGDIGEIDITVSGSGDVRLNGNAKTIDISISGSGDVDAHRMLAEDASVRVTGSGDVSVYASKSFNGRVSGSGDIDVYGDPPKIRRRVSGSGDIASR